MTLELVTPNQVQGVVVLVVDAQLLDSNGFGVPVSQPTTLTPKPLNPKP